MTEIISWNKIETSDLDQTKTDLKKLEKALQDWSLNDIETSDILQMSDIKNSLKNLVDDMLQKNSLKFENKKSYENFKSVMDRFWTLNLPSYATIEAQTNSEEKNTIEFINLTWNHILVQSNKKQYKIDYENTNYSMEQLKTITNAEFLNTPINERLKYVTKEKIDGKNLENWTNLEISFDVDQDGKDNQDLYLHTTAGQVFPQDVWTLKLWDEKYTRAWLNWEFFSWNERLIIKTWTQLEVWKRSLDDLKLLNKWNSQKFSKYFSKHPNCNQTIVQEAIKRDIDPKFAELAFGKLLKNAKNGKMTPELEDAFTEFDREVWRTWISRWLENGRQNSNLVLFTFAKIDIKNYKVLAKEYWITQEEIASFVSDGSENMSLKAASILNSDSLPNGERMKSEALLNDPVFSKRLDEVCASIWTHRECLATVMKAESWLNSRAVNPSSNATWLIQFMPSTAKSLWTSVWALRAMSAVKQLDYVEKYFKMNWRWKTLDSTKKLYQATFYPLSLVKWPDYIFWSEQSMSWARKVANQNPWIKKFSNNWLIDQQTFAKYVNSHTRKYV